MNELLPIIRRKRRPLVVADAPPVVVGNVEAVQAVATKPAESVVTDSKPPKSDDQEAAKRES